MKIYMVTGSKNKYFEIKKFLKEKTELEMLEHDLLEIQELDLKKIVEHKLNEAIKLYPNKDLIVEDTSLKLDCLNGLPGPFIKWFLKSMTNEEIFNICKKYENYNAEGRVLVGLVKDNKKHYFNGFVKGKIVSPRKTSSFGWDVIFMPEGYDKTFSEMKIEEKNMISHRAKGIQELISFLQR